MITHDQLAFCLCMLDSRIKRPEHGTKFLVVMPIDDDGNQLGDAYIDSWHYDFDPPSDDDVKTYWSKNSALFEIDPMCQGVEVAQRSRRDRLLEEMDAFVSNPMRWSSMNEDQHKAWADYRQALLDVPQQAGFPNDIEWPVSPNSDT